MVLLFIILEPGNFSAFQSSIAIQNVEAGYQPIGDVGDAENDDTLYGNIQTLRLNSLSDPCENATVNCDPSIQCQQDKMAYARSVALFSTNGRGGTGTLINNEANNGRAYFLTAFHVIDKNKNGILDASEIAALATARFQFQFWRTHCGGSINNDWKEFSGAILRASSHVTDVALLEMLNPPGIGDLVNYAGYSRQTSAPADYNGFVIHHPRGEDMRVTDLKNVNSWFWNNNYWSAHYYSGTVDRGSSGSALMNQNGQIIGQLRSGWSCCIYTDFGDRYGKFDKSWSGAGLQTWLSPNQNLQSTNLLNLTDIPINGTNIISCTTPTQYTTIPNLLDVNYTWSVSTGLQIISGQGTATVTISGLTGNQYGSGTLTLTLNSPTKGRTRTYTVSKVITINTGSISGTYNSPTNSEEPLVPIPHWNLTQYNAACIAFRTNMAVPSGSTVTWTGSADPGVTWYQTANDVFCNFTAVGQMATLTVQITNSCGTSSSSYRFKCTTANSCGIIPMVVGGGVSIASDDGGVSLAPNPASNILQVSLKETTGKTVARNISGIDVFDKLGNRVLSLKYRQSQATVHLDISTLNPDVYMIKVFDGQSWTTEKFIKQ